MAHKPFRGEWVTKSFRLSSAYALRKNSILMLSSGEAVQGSSSAGIEANPIVGIYQGPAIATSALTAGTTYVKVQCPKGPCVIESDCSGAFTTGTIGTDYGLSSGSSTGTTDLIGLGNTTVTPFTHIAGANSSGVNYFAFSGGTLQARSVS